MATVSVKKLYAFPFSLLSMGSWVFQVLWFVTICCPVVYVSSLFSIWGEGANDFL